MTTDNAKRDSILAKIRALQSKTVENGCTEAEAMAAAAMAGGMLEAHGLTMTDTEIGEELCKIEYLDTGRKTAHEVFFCSMAIAAYTDCRSWGNGRHGSYRIHYFGLTGDVETAVYLTRIIRAAMDREWMGYAIRSRELSGGQASRRDAHTFMIGMANRVNARLKEMKAHTAAETFANTGRSLVVVKGSVVATQFAALGMTIKTKRTSLKGTHDAYAAGKAAGDRVGFNRGVGQAGAPLMIGR